jgi:hypothetical protein
MREPISPIPKKLMRGFVVELIETGVGKEAKGGRRSIARRNAKPSDRGWVGGIELRKGNGEWRVAF